MNLFEFGILRRILGVDFVRGFLQCFEDRQREGFDLDIGVLFFHLLPGVDRLGEVFDVHIHRRGLHPDDQHGLIFFGQFVEGFFVDQKLHFTGGFMPSCVVVFGDFVEAHLDVHSGPDPLQSVDRTAVERGVEFAGGDVGDIDSQLGHDFSGKAGDPHLEPFEVGDAVDRLAEPTAHLVAGVAAGEAVDTEFVVDFPHIFHSVAVVEPGILLGGGHPEGDGGEPDGIDIFALPVVGAAVAHLELSAFDHVEDSQRRFVLLFALDFDDELPTAHLFHPGCQFGRRGSQRSQCGGPGLREFPTDLFCSHGRSEQHRRSGDRTDFQQRLLHSFSLSDGIAINCSPKRLKIDLRILCFGFLLMCVYVAVMDKRSVEIFWRSLRRLAGPNLQRGRVFSRFGIGCSGYWGPISRVCSIRRYPGI